MMKVKVKRTLDDAIDEWSTGTLECRGFGQHMWQRLTVTRRPGVITLHQRCPRCKKERAKDFNERMYPLDRWHYSDVPGFTVNGHGRLTPDDKSKILMAFIAKVPVIDVVDE
jgi:hypothetical protein